MRATNLSLVTLLLIAGCTSAQPPTPTPDIPATVTAAVEAALPTAALEITTGSAPDTLMVPSKNEVESGIQKLAAKVVPGSERDEIIEFTRSALAIEAERNALMAYFASLREQIGREGAAFQVNRAFLTGISEQWSQSLAEHPAVATVPLQGMLSLHSHLLLLDVPQALEPVKDSLGQAYATEILLAHEQVYIETPEVFPGPSPGVRPSITMDNLDALRMESYWGQTQLFRKQIYERWAEILQEQGIDPAEDGFKELILTQ